MSPSSLFIMIHTTLDSGINDCSASICSRFVVEFYFIFYCINLFLTLMPSRRIPPCTPNSEAISSLSSSTSGCSYQTPASSDAIRTDSESGSGREFESGREVESAFDSRSRNVSLSDVQEFDDSRSSTASEEEALVIVIEQDLPKTRI